MSNSDELPPVDVLSSAEENEDDSTLTTAPATAAQVGVLEKEGTGVDDELDDEAIVEGAVISSVQIAPTGDTNPISDINDPMLFIELGDRVVIDSKKYGRTIGTVYYRSYEFIKVKPDGVSNALHTFELEQTDEEELYKEEDGVTAAYVIEKRQFHSFVEQQDFRINQIIDTFDSSGDLYKSYKIVGVDKENDYIKIQDEDDEDDVRDLEFNFVGIEPDEDFTVISIRQLVGPSEEGANVAEGNVVEEEDAALEAVESEEAEEAEEDEPKIVGFVRIARPKVFKEAETYEQRIPDNLQKIDALNDFISSLDPTLQKDPKSVRAVRVLVETLFNLKQATIAYNDDGSIRGQKEISASTLAELIAKTFVPLGRPVLNVQKKEYFADDVLDEEGEAAEKAGESDEVFFENFVRELDVMVQNKSQLVSSAMAGAPGGQIVREWNDQATFLKQYLSPWVPNGQAPPLWKAVEDSDFFRSQAPETTEDEDGKVSFVSNLPGYIASGEKDVPPIFTKIPFGIERALSTTYRKGADRKKQALLPEDAATMNSYLLFPTKTANSIGTTRSGSLAVDSGRNQLQPQTMASILEELGGPKEVATSNDIVLLDVERNTLGNIPLADYIDGLSVPALGIGDTFSTLEQYGMDNLELTPEIIDVINKKIELYQSQLLSTIAKLRAIIENEKAPEVIDNPFLDNPSILETVLSQPMLVEDIQEYERINPTLAKSDLGKVAYLLNKHAVYFQVAAGKNSVLIAKELLRANNLLYLQSLKIANILKFNQLNAGDKPVRNTCKHVADLVAVRKIYDDTERFQRFNDFFRKYQGEREDNWINCNVCQEHLICVHERLQLQAFLNPKEKATIEKEIILKFAGGQFQGKYICRNCGQAIRDLDFDNNIEFDDNGKPKSGRSVLVDEDAILEEKLDLLVSVPIEPSEKKDLQLSDTEVLFYNITREIAERVGVNVDQKGYRNIIDRAISWVNKFPTKDDYAVRKAKRPTLPDYDVAIARNTITSCATFLLIEIQSRIPSYVVRYALIGCKSPGFDGYPLDSDPSKKQGIEYIACAVSSIRRNEAPWNQTGFQKIADDVKRQQGIVVYIENVLKEIIADDVIQAKLSEKKKYLSEVLGADADKGRPHDLIPATFLPEQTIVTPEMAAKDAITPEIAANMGPRGRLALVKLWIRQSHLLAKNTASLVRGTSHSETTCCLTKVGAPGLFWKSVSDLPPLGRRTLVPNQQGQFLVTEFNPRDSGSVVAEPDKEQYFRVFLKYCFQGPRTGYPHEPGLTNECPWCGFQFPTNPLVMDADTEGKPELLSQKVSTNTEDFNKLLDKIHTVNKVEPVKTTEVLSVREIMAKFGDVSPSPIPGWGEIISETTEGFLRLGPDADRGDIAIAAGPISDATLPAEKIIEERAKEQLLAILQDITKLPWSNFFQVLEAYFIIPFQRILSQYNEKSLFVPTELKLSDMHVKDIQTIIDSDLYVLSFKKDDIKKPAFSFARSKLRYFVKQLSALLPYKNEVRPIVVPGRELTLEYIQRALLYGPVASLINPSDIPEGTEISSPVKSIGDPSMRYLLDVLSLTLTKYKKERLTFSDQDIKEMIAIRDEKERVNVVADFDKLTDEEKAIELVNKRLGLGKWAVGGTKLIYAYDKDYYDLERQKREAAGIIDFPGLGPGEMPALDGRPVDEYGFPVFDDAEFEREGGYDHNQHGDDDYE